MSIAKETLLHAYRTMKTIREFEERVNAEIMNGQIPGFTHLYTCLLYTSPSPRD